MAIVKKGKFAGNPQKAEIDTRFKASAAIKFGKGVELGASDDVVATFAGGYFEGLALEANEKIGTDDVRDYDADDALKVLKKGIAYVELVEDVDLNVDGPQVGVDSATGDFGTESSYTAVEGLQFLDGGVAGDEVRVRFNLPA